MRETYTTPEDFRLARPLLFPEARSFEEILVAEGPWDHSRMGHRNGVPLPDHPVDLSREGFERKVGRFCSVSGMPDRTSMVVTPTPMVMDRIFADEPGYHDFTFFDRVGFKAIYHKTNDRVLIVADASGIIASRWLAYVSLDSVPTFD